MESAPGTSGSTPETDVYEKHWSRFSELQDRINTIKEKHNKLRERSKKKKTPKSPAKTTLNELHTNVDKNKTDGFSWSDIRPYLNINKHLVQTTGTNTITRSGLELKVEDAIKKRDLDKVIALSDQLAARDLAKQITDACDAKRYLEKRKLEEGRKHVSKKRKIAWGFEQKQRWETKGNM